MATVNKDAIQFYESLSKNSILGARYAASLHKRLQSTVVSRRKEQNRMLESRNQFETTVGMALKESC
jgi:hypothetical protein